MKDYRITVKVRNNRILKAIEDCGGTPGQKWCEANGLGYGRVNDLINMTTGPLNADGELYKDSLKLCDVLDKLPEDLWSKEQLFPLEKNFSEMEMDYQQVVNLLPNNEQFYIQDLSDFENRQQRELIGKALDTLGKQEQEVIRLRFYEDATLVETGKRLGVTKERIRQIETRALRKLRDPKRVKFFADCKVK